MAYAGAGLSLMVPSISGGGMQIWQYDSTDAATTVRVTGYISDALSRGMKAGDIVWSRKTDASPYSIQCHIVTTVSATTGVADLSDGLAITATNTD